MAGASPGDVELTISAVAKTIATSHTDEIGAETKSYPADPPTT